MKKVSNAVLIWGPVSGEGVEYLKLQAKQVVICENRPYLLGLIHNKPLLEKQGIRVVYCTDNTIGHLFYQKAVREIVLFCRRENGIIKGVSGSLYVWLLAKIHNLPIKIFREAEICWQEIKDKDAGSLGGRPVIGRGSVEPAEYEVLET